MKNKANREGVCSGVAHYGPIGERFRWLQGERNQGREADGDQRTRPAGAIPQIA